MWPDKGKVVLASGVFDLLHLGIFGFPGIPSTVIFLLTVLYQDINLS